MRIDIKKEASVDLSALRSLKPDDLWGVMILDRDGGDSMLPQLTHLTGLRMLRLRDANITSQGLMALAPLRNLKILDLSGGRLDDQATYLSQLPSLETLSIAGLNFTDAVLAHVAKMPAIKHLALVYAGIGDDGVAHLQNSSTLESILFWKSFVTDKGIIRCLTSKT